MKQNKTSKSSDLAIHKKERKKREDTEIQVNQCKEIRWVDNIPKWTTTIRLISKYVPPAVKFKSKNRAFGLSMHH